MLREQSSPGHEAAVSRPITHQPLQETVSVAPNAESLHLHFDCLTEILLWW